MDAVTLKTISKTYQGETIPALQELSTTLKTGQITGLVGPDGAGKTTLIRLLTGLLELTEGEIRIYGLNPKTQSAEIQDILGYMPQKFGLYDDLTVMENMTLYSKLKNIPQEEIASIFEKMLHFTNLKEFTGRLAGKLSGGMKQKLGLACALMGNPKLLLLDEPSVGVDPISRQELWSMVKAIAAQDIVVVWSTAYLDEAEKCDHILLLNEGHLLYEGSPHELTKTIKDRVFLLSPPPMERRQLLNSILTNQDVIDGVIQGDKIRMVLKKECGDSPLHRKDIKGIVESTTPRFEDAFIDILKNNRIEPTPTVSLLAAQMHPKRIFKENPIDVRHLTKKFGDFTAAHDINFSVKQGEIFGLLGPNGAGKSTTFKMLCSLLKPTEGEALVLGHDLKHSTSFVRLRIGYMAQKFSLYSNLSVLQNLNFFSGVYGLQGKKQRHKIDQIIEIFEMQNHLKTNAGLLPLGYKQRLALACAVMHEPDILFLDEPTSGVDPLTRREFWLHINQMVQKGTTVMVTTHFMDEAENCDRIALIYRGETIALGTPDALKMSVQSDQLPNPTLEDAFIALVRREDGETK